jgi:cobalt-zinc-cadmium efflux system protein
VKSTAHILLEGTPSGVNLADIKADLEQNVTDVKDAHHIHAWSITSEQHLLTLHVHPVAGAIPREVVTGVQRRLSERFSIQHVTVQIEETVCIDEHITGHGPKSTDCH